MKVIWLLTTLFLLGICSAKMNVLFIISDDLRSEANFLSDKDILTPIQPKLHTPNLDKLADKSLVLTRSYVQQSICGPSRASFLTGRRPDTTHVYKNIDNFRISGGDFTTIPQFFKKNHYATIGIGKIFHEIKMDRKISWTEKPIDIGTDRKFNPNVWLWKAVTAKQSKELGHLRDEAILSLAVKALKRFAPNAKTGEKPLFLAVGFHKPHPRFVSPEKFWKYYPMNSIQLPDNQFVPVDMPRVAWKQGVLVRAPTLIKEGIKITFNTTYPDEVVKNIRRAYYSCISYIDSLVGQLLQTLDDVGMAKNTIVVFLGDHGFHLGENGLWLKRTNFEMATRAPMVIHIPGKTDKGFVIRNMTEFVDLFPTLVEATGFNPLQLCPRKSNDVKLCREGSSLMTLINNPSGKDWKKVAFSQVNRKSAKTMGYTMRTDRYRYTEWPEFRFKPPYKPNWDNLRGVELYDHQEDPFENFNIANKKGNEAIVERLSKILHAGWRPVQEQ